MNGPESLEKRFFEGLCLAAGGEHDRAGDYFLDCVASDPTRVDFIEEFLANLARRFPHHQQPMGLPQAADPEISKAVGQRHWDVVLQKGTRLLASNPWQLPTLLSLAEACEAKGANKAEACYWRAALQVAGDDEIVQRAGKAFARLQEFDEALACWRRVEARDPEAAPPHMIADLAIAKSRTRERFSDPEKTTGQGDTSREAVRESISRRFVVAKTAFDPGAPTAPGVQFTPIQQLEAAIRNRPSIPELYLQLAQLYLDKDRDYDAERLLAKGRDATDRDARVQELWEEVTIERHAKRVTLAEQEVKATDNPQTRDALAQAIKERDRLEMEIYRARCKREPESSVSHYELGRRLQRADKLREAGQQFELAAADARQRGPAALEFGRCLEQLGELPQALRQFRLASESAVWPDQSEQRKDALCSAGKLALRIKLTKLARRYLTQLMQLDPNHHEGAHLIECT